MSDERYKYTQVPSPLVRPGGFGGMLSARSASVVGEEPDFWQEAPKAPAATAGNTAPKAQKPPIGREPAAVSGKRIDPLKIVIAVVVGIFVVNLLLGMIAGFVAVADDIFDEFFYSVEMGIDDALDSLFYE